MSGDQPASSAQELLRERLLQRAASQKAGTANGGGAGARGAGRGGAHASSAAPPMAPSTALLRAKLLGKRKREEGLAAAAAAAEAAGGDVHHAPPQAREGAREEEEEEERDARQVVTPKPLVEMEQVAEVSPREVAPPSPSALPHDATPVWPPPPEFVRDRRMMRYILAEHADRDGASHPEVLRPFESLEDAADRLCAYHVMCPPDRAGEAARKHARFEEEAIQLQENTEQLYTRMHARVHAAHEAAWEHELVLCCERELTQDLRDEVDEQRNVVLDLQDTANAQEAAREREQAAAQAQAVPHAGVHMAHEAGPVVGQNAHSLLFGVPPAPHPPFGL